MINHSIPSHWRRIIIIIHTSLDILWLMRPSSYLHLKYSINSESQRSGRYKRSALKCLIFLFIILAPYLEQNKWPKHRNGQKSSYAQCTIDVLCWISVSCNPLSAQDDIYVWPWVSKLPQWQSSRHKSKNPIHFPHCGIDFLAINYEASRADSGC